MRRRGLPIFGATVVGIGLLLAASACSDPGGSGGEVTADLDAANPEASTEADGGQPDGDADDPGPGPDAVDGSDSRPDAVDAALDADADADLPVGEVADPEPPDVPDAELETAACGPCAEDQVCYEDMCFAACHPDLDIAALAGVLAPELTVVGHVCASDDAVLAFGPVTGGRVAELKLTDSGATTTMQLVVWTLEAALGGPVLGQALATKKVEGSAALWEVFPGDEVAVDPTGAIAAFSYTTDGDSFPGEVIVVDVAAGVLWGAIDAPGNFDVALVDGQTLLITSIGVGGTVEGPGLYLVEVVGGIPSARRVVANLGDAVGRVAQFGDLVLVGGYADPWPSCGEEPGPALGESGARVFALSLGQLKASPTPVDAWCSASQLDIADDFWFLPDGHLVTRDTDAFWETSGLTAHEIQYDVEAGEPYIATSLPLTFGPTFRGARALVESPELLLSHPHGYLIATWEPPAPPIPDPGPELMPDAAAEGAADVGAETDASPPLPDVG